MHTFELPSPKVSISLRFPMRKKGFSLEVLVENLIKEIRERFRQISKASGLQVRLILKTKYWPRLLTLHKK